MVWIETAVVALVISAGGYLGWRLSTVKNKAWHLAYMIPLLSIWALVAGRLDPSVSYGSTLSSVLQSRLAGVIRVFFIMVLFLAVTPLLDLARKRRAVYAFVFLMAIYHLAPFLLPALCKGFYRGLDDTWDAHAVCIQNTSHTCGPAAAATVLRSFGLKATEGQLAIEARTNPIGGTSPCELAWALNKKYGDKGIVCKVIHLENVDELRRKLPFLATVELSFFSDHFVAVTGINDEFVILGDPLEGVVKLDHKAFMKRWRKGGIWVSRNSD